MAGWLLQKVASASGISRSSFLVASGRGASAPLSTRVPSIISNCMKPSKRTFLSQESEFSMKEWAAKFDAKQAKSNAELAAMDAQSDRFWKTQKWLWIFSGINCLVGILSELELKRRKI